jgi:hypothetical protein
VFHYKKSVENWENEVFGKQFFEGRLKPVIGGVG